VDRRQGQVAGQAAGGSARVDPGELEGDEGQGQVLGALDEPSLGGVHEQGSQPGLVEGRQQLGLAVVPFVGIANAVRDHARNEAAGDRPGGLDDHLQVVPLGKAPHDLPDVVTRKGAQSFHDV
jgi:hypothetical protein